MTVEKLTTEVLPAVEQVAEVVVGAAPAFDPQSAAQAAQAADFAGMVANDPDATQRYVDSLLRLLEIVQDPTLAEVIRTWSN